MGNLFKNLISNILFSLSAIPCCSQLKGVKISFTLSTSFLKYNWCPTFYSTNELMFPRSTCNFVYVNVIVINGYWGIRPKPFPFYICLKKIDARLKKSTKIWFFFHSFITNKTYHHLSQISFGDFFYIHFFVLKLKTSTKHNSFYKSWLF